MRRPDFAHTNLDRLPNKDLRLLVENMPEAGRSYEDIARVLQEMPTTLESMLSSEYVFRMIRGHEWQVLDISPFLLFSVLLRRSLGTPRSQIERRVINYLANLLTLFIHTERVYRIEPDDPVPHAYVWELIQALEEDRDDPRREFVTCAHIGNYALWLTGLQPEWLEYRQQYGRRPLDPKYYEGFGQSYFDRAAKHRLARDFGLDDVFLRLAMLFEVYRKGLNLMRRQYMGAA